MEHGNSGNLIKNTRADASVPVVIVASAFGAQAIRRDGHAAWAEIAAKAGAAGFEVRRELFSYKAQSQPASLYELGQRIRAAGIWPVYSTPASLFDDTGALDERAMEQTLDEAAALDARIVKFQLGGSESAGTVTDCATLDRLIAGIRNSKAQVVVENGQLQAGGTIDAFSTLFDALANRSHTLSMTFDTGNWRWAQQDPLEAARRLAKYVGYVHCKAVQGEGARRFATAPATGDAYLAALLAYLPAYVPRGIEFPFDQNNLAADAARYVKQLASA
ncbi:sugar phosphate isomerase/epimerase family protein [Caballeronia sordidicola]|uniref:Epimerase KguE n=1 Tax=Caballeronia sordidicola TaxID=196367 RepID=A0A226WUW2_CABSO|nr:sugar phosphate isomerase/epimerase [Caballeronia sordidicola]OXC74639.1 Epimerase KguE [Caballeronia sordidicola]